MKNSLIFDEIEIKKVIIYYDCANRSNGLECTKESWLYPDARLLRDYKEGTTYIIFPIK